MLMSPGHIRSASADNYLKASSGVADTSAQSNNLFYPLEFEYLFPANSDIQFDVKNGAAYANSYNICLHGIRILDSKAVRGA